MIAKVTETDVRLNDAPTVKIVIDGKTRYKNVSGSVIEVLENRAGAELSDVPLPGFRKLKLQKDFYSSRPSGFMVTKSDISDGEVFLCKRGLRDIGFTQLDYVYVKLGRKSRANREI